MRKPRKNETPVEKVAARLSELKCCQKTVIVAISGYGQEEDAHAKRALTITSSSRSTTMHWC
ncbi:hypothetical protein V5E97_04085 [Singulisphaera sp. Ch08]|uniref:Transposase n=1 Tax=Singulisphaera sp. Ch08 TaxID=3120278 RepID=A0AAU7CJU6_9BACT